MLTAAPLRFAVPIDLDREEARQAAREELAKEMYRTAEPGYVERAFRWFFDQLDRLLEQASAASPGGWVSLLGLVALVVAAIVAVRLKVGPLARAADVGDPLFVGRPMTAQDYRAAADAHAAQQRWAEAVRDRLRAIIRSLEERHLLDPRPGRTADEAAREAGAALPQCAEALASAARDFDDIWYGGRTARPDTDARLRELDRRVQTIRPVALGGSR